MMPIRVNVQNEWPTGKEGDFFKREQFGPEFADIHHFALWVIVYLMWTVE